METSPANAPAKVFVVDDDASLCRALERFLTQEGHEVETFASAEEFLSRSPLPEEGALILDVRLPGIRGHELQAQLAASGSGLRILFVTGSDDPYLREAALGAGARAWLTKPIDVEALLAALADPLGRIPGALPSGS